MAKKSKKTKNEAAADPTGDDLLDKMDPGTATATETAEEGSEASEPQVTNSDPNESTGLTQVGIEAIVRDPDAEAIRSRIDDEELAGMQASVKTYGILTPLTVVADPDTAGKYRLIGGYRRLKVAENLGLKTVPVRVLDAASFGAALGERIDRKRVDLSMVTKVAGLIDNLDRAALPEADILRGITTFIEIDRSGRYKKDGKIAVQPLSKDLGVGYNWLRNRVAVLANFEPTEIAEIDTAIEQGMKDGDGALTWTKVHTALRSSGADGVDAIKALVWPEKYALPDDDSDSGDEGGDKAPKSKKDKAADKLSEVRKPVKFDKLADNGVSVRLIGTKGGKSIEAEVTIRVPLKGTTFTGERGDQNLKNLFEEIERSAHTFAVIGTGKDKANADSRVGLLAAFDSAVHVVKGSAADD